MNRIAIDDVLPSGSAVSAAELRTHPALRGLSVCLDQVVNRAIDETRRDGRPAPPDSYEHAADLAHAEKLVAQLDAAAAAGRA
ncbi:MAG: hypothetical protein K2X91_11355, partial [Thermoleophilia bacterium]|nr:hypothetical protein [Thermoleophilia bacterium]